MPNYKHTYYGPGHSRSGRRFSKIASQVKVIPLDRLTTLLQEANMTDPDLDALKADMSQHGFRQFRKEVGVMVWGFKQVRFKLPDDAVLNLETVLAEWEQVKAQVLAEYPGIKQQAEIRRLKAERKETPASVITPTETVTQEHTKQEDFQASIAWLFPPEPEPVIQTDSSTLTPDAQTSEVIIMAKKRQRLITCKNCGYTLKSMGKHRLSCTAERPQKPTRAPLRAEDVAAKPQPQKSPQWRGQTTRVTNPKFNITASVNPMELLDTLYQQAKDAIKALMAERDHYRTKTQAFEKNAQKMIDDIKS